MRRLLVAVVLVVVAACGSADPETAPPVDDTPSEPPLVLFLHGYGGSGTSFAEGSGLLDDAEAADAVVLSPDGTEDVRGNRFWNASDACCDFGDLGVDDVARLAGLIEEAAAKAPVGDVLVVGFSNGAFMAHRLACERPDLIDGIVAIAGSLPLDADECAVDGPVRVLAVHGDDDRVINYDGGDPFFAAAPYPGAVETIGRWADWLACGLPSPAGEVDLVEGLPGAETAVLAASDCPEGADAELWTVRDANHQIPLTEDATERVWAWLTDG